MITTFVEDSSTILDLSLQQHLVSSSEKNYLMAHNWFDYFNNLKCFTSIVKPQLKFR